jgi:hypothetical protein
MYAYVNTHITHTHTPAHKTLPKIMIQHAINKDSHMYTSAQNRSPNTHKCTHTGLPTHNRTHTQPRTYAHTYTRRTDWAYNTRIQMIYIVFAHTNMYTHVHTHTHTDNDGRRCRWDSEGLRRHTPSPCGIKTSAAGTVGLS